MPRPSTLISFRGEEWLIIRTWRTTDRMILLEHPTGQRILTTHARITADQAASPHVMNPAPANQGRTP